MSADKVEHRGIEAYQSVCGSKVPLVRNGTVIGRIRSDKRNTADEVRQLIDDFLDNGGVAE